MTPTSHGTVSAKVPSKSKIASLYFTRSSGFRPPDVRADLDRFRRVRELRSITGGQSIGATPNGSVQEMARHRDERDKYCATSITASCTPLFRVRNVEYILHSPVIGLQEEMSDDQEDCDLFDSRPAYPWGVLDWASGWYWCRCSR